jgi:hypothetical protein
MTATQQFRARKAINALAFRQRHGAAWLAYLRDWTQRKRAAARRNAGRPATRTDLLLSPEPVKCPRGR